MKMSLVAGVAALAMLGAAPAFAQTACPPAPAAPAFPDGATAKPADMQKGQKAYDAWRTTANAAVECENNTLKTLQAQPNVAKYIEASKAIKDLQDTPEVKDYFAKQDVYKAKTDPVFAASQNWQKSVEAFNARAGGKK